MTCYFDGACRFALIPALYICVCDLPAVGETMCEKGVEIMTRLFVFFLCRHFLGTTRVFPVPRPRYANASLRRFSTLLRQQVDTLASAIVDLESTHASSLGRCVSQMEDHVEEACRVPGPSGGTPEGKRYPRPDKFRWKWRRGEGNKPERCGKFPGHFYPRLRSQEQALPQQKIYFLVYTPVYSLYYYFLRYLVAF